jgi:muconate cycloisomerase
VHGEPLTLALRQPYYWRLGADETTQLVLFTVETDDGVRGYGEAIADNDAGVVATYSAPLAPYFVGRSPAEVEGVLQDVWSHGRWRLTPRFVSQAIAGIEMACWDALGKTLGVPAHTFFGGAVRTEIDTFGFPQGKEPTELAAHARAIAEEGYRVVYLKVGREEEEEEEEEEASVAAVREAIGPNRKLRIDANEAWDVPTAIDRIRRLERYDLDWVEQPVSSDNVRALAQVRRAVSTKIAIDQGFYTAGELRAALELEAADVIVLGVHEAGGLWRLRQMAYVAEVFGIPINRHGNAESSITSFAALHAAAAIPNLADGNQIMHQLLAEDLTVAPPVALGGGRLAVPVGPGLGFELDEDAIARARARYRAGAAVASAR